MKQVLILFFLISAKFCFGQQIYKAKIVDGITNEIIPYANVRIVGSTKGFVSNDNGAFEVELFKVPLSIVSSNLLDGSKKGLFSFKI